MRSPIAKAGWIFGIFMLVTAALLVMSVRRQTVITCEVCVTFRGNTACRTASGSTHAEAQRTAHENACALISGGMTDSISCGNKRPDAVVCSDDPGR